MRLIFHAHVRELITTLNGTENANISAISNNTCPTELIGFYAANKTVPRSLDEVSLIQLHDFLLCKSKAVSFGGEKI